MRGIVACLIALICAGCTGGGGVVVFAPTPLPPDLSPLTYTHPGEAFSVTVPRTWSIYTQNTATLASATFSPPGATTPPLTISAIHLEGEIDLPAFINRYQVELRPDVSRYIELNRGQMVDGSWRLSGYTRNPAGTLQPVNTFIVQEGQYIAIAEVSVVTATETFAELETIINTLTLNPDSLLQPTSPEVLAAITTNDLEFVDVQAWWTDDGLFFITGEVFNHTAQTLGEVPIRVALFDVEGEGVGEAIDRVMGHALPPGDFAPFSLRFDNPEGAANFTLEMGSPAVFEGELATNQDIDWTFEPSRADDGDVIVEGVVTNTGTRPVERPLVTLTVFDAERNVIAAGFTVITEDALDPDESQSYVLRLPDMGGTPQDYFVNVQALR